MILVKKKKAYFRKEYKISINSQGLLNIYKRNNGLKKVNKWILYFIKTRNVKKTYYNENEIYLWCVI